MIYCNKIPSNKIDCICFIFLFLFITYGCQYKKPVLERQEQKNENLKGILADPVLITLSSVRYYTIMGKWPDSTYDFEKLNKKPFSEIDWTSFRDNIVFETLPDGRLKITLTEPNFNYSATLPIPTKEGG